MPILSVEKLVKRYRSPEGAVAAVVDVDHFELNTGEQVALRGESGSGKTTFLNLIAGILRADEGRVVVNREEMTAVSEATLPTRFTERATASQPVPASISLPYLRARITSRNE